jgi:phage/plasmid-like protein (TIGR03299 family)
LDFSKGKAAIAFRGEVPWHGYGEIMQPGMTIDEWIEAAGLDYEVMGRPAYFLDTDGEQVHIPQAKALVRSDTNTTLSMVSQKYKVVQPRQIIEFFRDLTERQGFELETAGALANGRRVWGLARLGRDFVLDGGDKVDGYLLLATSYDGKFATTAQLTSIRVVCNNTLTWSLEDGGNQHVVRVLHSQDFDPATVRTDLGLLDASWTGFTTAIKEMSQVHVSELEAVLYFMELIGEEEEDPQFAIDNNYMLRKLMQGRENAPGAKLPSADGTIWGLLNAVTYFTDHIRRAHDAGSRVNSAWFGQSAVLKRQALEKAQRLTQLKLTPPH